MKKLLSIFVFALVTFTAAQAQSGFGIRGGANFSNLEGDLKNESRYENKIGFHGGVTYGIDVIDNFFFIQPELLYSTKGFKYRDSEITLPTGSTFRREGNINYNYIDLPVLAKIKAGPIYFEAGPQASYLLSVNNKTKESLNGDPYSSSTKERDIDGLRRFEVGYAAGVGFATSSGISLGVRYNGSLTDFVNKNPEDYFEGDLTNARHSTIMATVGFTFGGR
ncbi:porin family protein [Pontibacter toksunensis]